MGSRLDIALCGYTKKRSRRMSAICTARGHAFRLRHPVASEVRTRNWDTKSQRKIREDTTQMKKVFATLALAVFGIAGATAVYSKQEKVRARTSWITR
jgi:hypothetical protein